MISVTVLTKNSQDTLADTLDSLKTFSEVLLLDSGSIDSTLDIARNYPNVTIHTSPFLGFGPMHNYAVKLASHDWILSIDSDEVLTPELIDELHALELDPKKVYEIPRHNYFNGKWIKYCGGWHPDHVVRLFHKKNGKFSDVLVHEKVESKEGLITSLSSPLKHTPYLRVGDFLNKMQLYSDLFAEQKSGEPASVIQALFHGWFAFFKSYFLKRGFLAGREGFIISMYNGHTAYYKWLKLAQKSYHPSESDESSSVLHSK